VLEFQGCSAATVAVEKALTKNHPAAAIEGYQANLLARRLRLEHEGWVSKSEAGKTSL
jgi:hypothetical protein